VPQRRGDGRAPNPRDAGPGTGRATTPAVQPTAERRVLTISLCVVAVVAVLFFLRTARDLLVPIALAVLVSHALEPVVSWLERHGLPRVVGAPGVVLLVLALAGGLSYSLIDDAVQVVESLPTAARQARELVTRHVGRSAGAVERAAAELEKLPGAASTTVALGNGGVVERVVTTVFTAAGEAVVIIFLVLFLLLLRDRAHAGIIEIAGPSPERRRLTSRIIDDIEGQIQQFLIVLVLTGAIVAVLTWAALAWLGVSHAAVWGILTGVFNSIPYFGPVIVSGGLFVVGLVQGGDLAQALLMSGIALAITSLEGWLLTPLLMGKAENMNALTVFIGLMLWTWLWGGWGTILAVPMLVILKSTADHVPGLSRVGRLMAP
jgi:predicted PurR-regulated permease PerM